MNEDILFALSAANAAPSGENSQPWRFIVREDKVELWNRPERDRSLYNWQQSASYVSNGAALENMVIAASARGLATEVEYFPQTSTDHVATVRFTRGASPDPLAEPVLKRATNRKPYSKESLTPAQAGALSGCFEKDLCSLRLIGERDAINRLGRIGSTNEEIMLTSKQIHSFFFEHVNWTPAEDAKKTVGFFIDTLELPPPARVMFRLLRRWPVALLLTRLGLHRVIAKENGAVNASAAAIGIVSVRSLEPTELVRAGRAIERIWLTATSLGLSFQPLSGMLFFELMRAHGDASKFSETHAKMIEEAYAEVRRISGFSEGSIVFMFRTGIGEPPTARSSRFTLERTMQAE